MEAGKKIELALAYSGLKKADLARALGMSPQNLQKRLQTGKFTFSEFERIAEITGSEFYVNFVFPDGTEV